MSATSATAARRRAADSTPASPPVLFAIDDDPGVINSLRDDLSRRFGVRVVHEYLCTEDITEAARNL